MTRRHPFSTLFAVGLTMLGLPFAAGPVCGQNVEVTVQWNQPISKPEQIRFPTSDTTESLVSLETLNEWKGQVATRSRDRRLNRRAELQLYYDPDYSIPARIMIGVGQTKASLVLGSRLYNCDPDGARALETLIEGNRTNHANLANAIFSAKRMYDGPCSFESSAHRSLFQNLLVRAVRYYGALNERTLDLGLLVDGLVPDAERAALQSLYRTSQARQLALEVNDLLDDSNADRDLVRAATGELVELATSDEFAGTFAAFDWQRSRYEGYLLNFEYRDIIQAIETVALTDDLVYSALANRVQRLKAISAAPAQSEEQQAFQGSSLSPALLDAMVERLTKLRMQAIAPAASEALGPNVEAVSPEGQPLAIPEGTGSSLDFLRERGTVPGVEFNLPAGTALDQVISEAAAGQATR